MDEEGINKTNKELQKLNRKLQTYKKEYMKVVKSIKKVKEKIWKIEQKRLKSISNKPISDQKIPDKNLIEENIKRIEKGEKLTVPLSQLDNLFKLEYNKRFKTNIPLISAQRHSYETIKNHHSFERNCVICGNNFKTKHPYKTTCSRKCRLKYVNSPELIKIKKEKLKEYRQRPEVKERLKEYQKEYNRKRKVAKNKFF